MNTSSINDIGGSSRSQSCSSSVFEQYLKTARLTGGANLMGADLYKSLNTYFTSHLKGVRSVSPTLWDLAHELTKSWIRQDAEELADEPLLKYYTDEWKRYTTGASYVNRLFTYLNRHWIKREKDEGRKNVYPVYTVRLHFAISD